MLALLTKRVGRAGFSRRTLATLLAGTVIGMTFGSDTAWAQGNGNGGGPGGGGGGGEGKSLALCITVGGPTLLADDVDGDGSPDSYCDGIDKVLAGLGSAFGFITKHKSNTDIRFMTINLADAAADGTSDPTPFPENATQKVSSFVSFQLRDDDLEESDITLSEARSMGIDDEPISRSMKLTMIFQVKNSKNSSSWYLTSDLGWVVTMERTGFDDPNTENNEDQWQLQATDVNFVLTDGNPNARKTPTTIGTYQVSFTLTLDPKP